MLLGEDTSKSLDDSPSTLALVLVVNTAMSVLTPDLTSFTGAACLLFDVEDWQSVWAADACNVVVVWLVSWAGSWSWISLAQGSKSLLNFVS